MKHLFESVYRDDILFFVKEIKFYLKNKRKFHQYPKTRTSNDVDTSFKTVE